MSEPWIDLDEIEQAAKKVEKGFIRFIKEKRKPEMDEVKNLDALHQLLPPRTILALVAAARTMDRLGEAVGCLKRSVAFYEPESEGELRLMITAMESVQLALDEATKLWDESFL